MNRDDIFPDVDRDDEWIPTPYDIMFGASIFALMFVAAGLIFAAYAFLWS